MLRRGPRHRPSLVAKSLERIGDHAKNIASHVIYAVKGADVRHATLAELEQQVRS
ncbi:MAG: PhoU domain-containing protein [Burkholderiales bacterium]